MNWKKRLQQLWGLVKAAARIEQTLQTPPAPKAPLAPNHPQKRKRPVRKNTN
jgi:hypothetical protein